MGKLIVLEGLDGSGKSTQLLKLEENLKAENVDIKTVSFPEYSEPSCEPVKMYLSGKFGNNPEDVSAYTASLFFAIDRYASFKLHWGEYYDARLETAGWNMLGISLFAVAVAEMVSVALAQPSTVFTVSRN